MRPVYVAGSGLHPLGRFAEKSLTALGMHAVREALADARVGRGAFRAAFCGTVYGGVAAGHKVLTALGLAGVPIVNVEAGCASGCAALALGAAAVASGRHDCVLVFGLEKMPRGIIRSSFFEPWREEAGLAATPAYFALRAQRLMLESDVRLEDLARVSAKNHRHGVANPYAMYRRALSVEDILASPVVCEPLRLLMLCAPNEGAAAVVLSAGPTPAPVAAAALRSAPRPSARSPSSPGSSAARRGRARCLARRSRSRTRWAAARTPASSYLLRPETVSRVGDGQREFRPVNRAHGVPRPAKPARQTCRSVSA